MLRRKWQREETVNRWEKWRHLWTHILQSPRDGARQVLPSEGGRRKLYAEAVKIEKNKRYRITLKAKDDTLSPEQIKL